LVFLVLLALTLALAPASAALYEVIHHLDSAGGYNPFYGAPQVVDSKVYGMTYQGGNSNLGVIYRCDLNGENYEVLKHFGSAPQASDGEGPLGSVIEYQSKLYGMTRYGGTNRVGVIFRCDLDGGNYEVVKHFGVIVNRRPDGLRPVASLIQHDGQLYGMATEGGTNGLGVLFRCNPDGSSYTILKDFTGIDGNQPHGDVLVHEGKIYGTTELGGTNGFPGGLLFRCDMDGANYEILKHFGGAAGAQPFGTPVVYDGQLYGLTYSGGNEGRGVIFRCDLDGGNYTVLKHLNFSSGQGPFGSLLLHGTRLYGMTFDGGANGLGVLFQCGLDGGNYTTLKAFGPSFSNPVDGRYPRGSVTFSGGKLYGVTSEGGTSLINGQATAGVLFRYSLPPAISGIAPGSGPVGADIEIVGHGFTETTNVAFAFTNDADFIVASDTNLFATVPATALDGPIVVRTPHGASTSVVHFIVNHAPIVVTGIVDQVGVYGMPFEFAFDATVFDDEDGDLLSYVASGLPPGVNFDGATRTFAGVPTRAGSFPVAVVASDSGNPPLAATNLFSINVAKAQLLATAEDKTRTYGTANPPLTILYGIFVGTDGPADLDTPPAASTAADLSSPSGQYPIILNGGLDDNYAFNLVAGTLTVTAVPPLLWIEFLPGAEGEPDQFAIRSQGLEPGSTYRVFASADLTEWALLNSVKVAADGRFEFLDIRQPEFTQRFYRVSSE
jgi:uncharacterized repeat protein (TIGR03803 family)